MSEQPSPKNSGGDEKHGKRIRRIVRKQKKISLPSVDALLNQFIQLNGAVIVGAMSTKDANLIHKNLNTVLQVQLKRANGEDAGHSQDAMMEMCRSDPRMINALEPFLTDVQIKALMSEDMDDSDESI
jgi:hypothetical protein